jgi:hypothetical protein
LSYLTAEGDASEAVPRHKDAPGRLRDAKRKAIEAAEQIGVADAIPSWTFTPPEYSFGIPGMQTKMQEAPD